MRVVFCNCSYKEMIDSDTRRNVLSALAGSGVELVAVPDLCASAARRDAELTSALAGDETVKIVACYPRAVRWLLRTTGVEPERVDAIDILNMRELDASEVVERLDLAVEGGEAEGLPDVSPDGEWVPWFPIIDYDRCVNCKQCLSFCPFGVYSLNEDGRVFAAFPENCKNNCPACARICPEVAIMFPKLGDAPINGADVTEEDVARCRMVLDEQARDLMDGDIHEVLKRRKLKAAYRKMERLARQQAEREKQACMRKTKGDPE